MRLVLIKSMTLFCNASAIDMHASESSAVSFHAVGRLPVVLLPVRHTQHIFLPCYGAESAARPYQWSSETISSRAPVAVVAVKTGGMQNPLSTIAQRTSMQTPVYNLHQRLPIWSLDKQAVWAESMSKWCFVWVLLDVFGTDLFDTKGTPVRPRSLQRMVSPSSAKWKFLDFRVCHFFHSACMGASVHCSGVQFFGLLWDILASRLRGDSAVWAHLNP